MGLQLFGLATIHTLTRMAMCLPSLRDCAYATDQGRLDLYLSVGSPVAPLGYNWMLQVTSALSFEGFGFGQM